MTTYPLLTLAAVVSDAGITAPSYADILASLKASYQLIFGADAYLEPDSQDGQLLAVFAQAIYDTNQAAIAVYNQFSPATAQGVGLSSVVKINGIQRLLPSSSTVPCRIVGVAGTTITAGVVQDNDGNQWNLPNSVVIPLSGDITVTATAAAAGSVEAGVQDVAITTPTLGWQTASFTSDATVGAPVERDATLRRRQSVSVALPAKSILGGLEGALANVEGVSQLKIYDNDTAVTDSNGIPSHSISVIIEGGDAIEIATAIALKKGPGTGTYGNQINTVLDSSGVPVTVAFYVPFHKTITVQLTVKALPGYTDGIGIEIKQAIVDMVNSLGIGGTDGIVPRTHIYGAIYGVSSPFTFNATNLLIAASPSAPTMGDVSVGFNELPICTLDDVSISVV